MKDEADKAGGARATPDRSKSDGRDTGDRPDFTDDDIEIIDRIWDVIGRTKRAGTPSPGEK